MLRSIALIVSLLALIQVNISSFECDVFCISNMCRLFHLTITCTYYWAELVIKHHLGWEQRRLHQDRLGLQPPCLPGAVRCRSRFGSRIVDHCQAGERHLESHHRRVSTSRPHWRDWRRWLASTCLLLCSFLRAHPKIAELLPGLEGVPLADLATNMMVLNRFRPRVQHAMNFIINNMDTPELLQAALPRLNAQYKMYVDYVSPEQQNKVQSMQSVGNMGVVSRLE